MCAWSSTVPSSLQDRCVRTDSLETSEVVGFCSHLWKLWKYSDPKAGWLSALEIGMLAHSWLMGQVLCYLGRSVLTEPYPGLLAEGRGAGPEKGLALSSTMLIREVS